MRVSISVALGEHNARLENVGTTIVRRQLLWPVALPHLGMLPTVLRKIVLRFQL